MKVATHGPIHGGALAAQGCWWVPKDGGDRPGSRERSESISHVDRSSSHYVRSPTIEACASRFMVQRLLLALMGARAAVSHRTAGGMLIAHGASSPYGTVIVRPAVRPPPGRPHSAAIRFEKVHRAMQRSPPSGLHRVREMRSRFGSVSDFISSTSCLELHRSHSSVRVSTHMLYK